ncbi:Uncharacterised protein [Mycobacteroides abscessus]|nr:Uncharacterised protein [Mycobacteroides abscessus]
MTGTPRRWASATTLTAATASTASSTRTSAPRASIDSACCCWFAASWAAFAYSTSHDGQRRSTTPTKVGRSVVS